MADRNFARDQGSLEKGLITLFAHITFGATGAPTLVRGKGIASVTRDAEGKFTLALQDRYQRLLGAAATFVVDNGTPAAPNVHVVEDDSADASAPAVTVQCSAVTYVTDPSAGVELAATDPGNGEAVLITLQFSNSTAL